MSVIVLERKYASTTSFDITNICNKIKVQMKNTIKEIKEQFKDSIIQYDARNVTFNKKDKLKI